MLIVCALPRLRASRPSKCLDEEVANVSAMTASFAGLCPALLQPHNQITAFS